MKYIHLFETESEFQKSYNAEKEIVSFTCVSGTFTYDRFDSENIAHVWTNGTDELWTQTRDAKINGERMAYDVTSEQMIEITSIEEILPENAYEVPWVSVTKKGEGDVISFLADCITNQDQHKTLEFTYVGQHNNAYFFFSKFIGEAPITAIDMNGSEISGIMVSGMTFVFAGVCDDGPCLWHSENEYVAATSNNTPSLNDSARVFEPDEDFQGTIVEFPTEKRNPELNTVYHSFVITSITSRSEGTVLNRVDYNKNPEEERSIWIYLDFEKNQSTITKVGSKFGRADSGDRFSQQVIFQFSDGRPDLKLPYVIEGYVSQAVSEMGPSAETLETLKIYWNVWSNRLGENEYDVVWYNNGNAIGGYVYHPVTDTVFNLRYIDYDKNTDTFKINWNRMA